MPSLDSEGNPVFRKLDAEAHGEEPRLGRARTCLVALVFLDFVLLVIGLWLWATLS